jgi:hypothetical protein
MTQEDVFNKGWWECPVDPANPVWRCPECGKTSPVADWADRPVGCQECGEHEGRKCPECAEVFDHIWGDATLAESQL